MAVSVLAYNALDGFGKPDVNEHLVEFVEAEKPNIAFFSEAFAEKDEDNGPLNEAVIALEGLGYSVLFSTYDDADDRKDRHGFLAICDLPASGGGKVRFGTRNGVKITSEDPGTGVEFDFLGLHAEDRNAAGRLVNFQAIPKIVRVAQEVIRPTILAGDLNDQHADTVSAQVLNMARPFANLIPAADPGEERMKIQTIGSLARRLTQMTGSGLKYLESLGFRDADDILRQPTMTLKGIPLFQLDHIMTSAGVGLVDGMHIHTHKTMKESDHLPISGTFAILGAPGNY